MLVPLRNIGRNKAEVNRSICLRALSWTAGRQISTIKSVYDGSGGYLTDGAAKGQTVFSNVNPANAEVINEVAVASPEEIDAAIELATEAQRVWHATPVKERRDKMYAAAQILKARSDEIAKIETTDVGKCYSESSSVDVVSGTDAIEYFAGIAPALTNTGRVISQFTPAYTPKDPNVLEHAKDGYARSHTFAYTMREPLGVCAGIGAWNYPFQISCWKSAPAIASGNSMIFKPSEMTPTSCNILAEAYLEAGIPKGVFQVVQGAGSVGAYLTQHCGIHKVSFTGEVGTGRKIMQASAGTLKKVTLELGGKSALIITEHADLERATTAALMANFYTQGEVCSNATRVFIHESIHDEIVERMVERIRKNTVIGDPMDMKSNVGALISCKHADLVLGYIKGAVEQGANLVVGSTERVSFPAGHPCQHSRAFVAPVILTDCTDDMTCVREEIFGPVMSVLKFNSEGEAVRRANESGFGLGAGIITNNLAQAHRLAGQLQAGSVWVNNYNLSPLEIPFGGYKQSGYGKENGTEALHHFTQEKCVYIDCEEEMGTVF
eukprot:Clim_evm108s25 gene=Clim_evmTU108s25